MKLRNKFDAEIAFDDLEAAKIYYLSGEKELSKDEYTGDDFDRDSENWKEYRNEIEQAKNLVELADVLNSYTDIFQNGSEWYVG